MKRWTGTATLIATALNDGVETPDELWSAAQERLDALQSGLASATEAWIGDVDLSVEPAPIARVPEQDFLDAVERSKEQRTVWNDWWETLMIFGSWKIDR